MKAILYAAKSTPDPRGSIPTQLEDCRAMATREGWDVAGEYSEESASAWSGDRGPQLAAAIAHAEQIAPAALLVQHSDRLARGDGRKARHLGEIYFWAIKADVELRSVQDDSTFTNPLLAFAMGERNAADSSRKSLAVAAGLKRRAERGLYTGRRPYGYSKADGLVVLEHEAEIVRRIFGELIAGATLTAIARALVADGIPTADGRAKWRQSTVAGIVHNPLYVGKLRHNGEVLDAAHEAIVDQATYDRANAQLAARNVEGRGRRPKGAHLFTNGLLRCGNCGDAMSPRTDSRGYEFYCCNGRTTLGNEHCTMRSVRRVVVDTAVYRYFEQVALDVEATRDQIAGERSRKLTEIRALATEAGHEVRRAEERLTRIRRDYTDGAIAAADWSELRAELEPSLEGARAEAEHLDAQCLEVEQWGAVRDAEAETYRRLAEIRAAIAGDVTDAEGIDAVRAALQRTFDRFILRGQLAGATHLELLGPPGIVIEPVIRDQAVDGCRETLAPIVRPETLPNKRGQPSVKPHLFGPIEVGV